MEAPFWQEKAVGYSVSAHEDGQVSMVLSRGTGREGVIFSESIIRVSDCQRHFSILDSEAMLGLLRGVVAIPRQWLLARLVHLSIRCYDRRDPVYFVEFITDHVHSDIDADRTHFERHEAARF